MKDCVPFGIYVHWPFCARKCPYCDFNSHVRSQIDEDGWREATIREIEGTAASMPGGRPTVSTIFFGGGTPSLMHGRTVESILGAVARLWPLAPDVEVSLEANPASADTERFRDYRAAGVNRLSLGIQALNDRDLEFLGRLHSVADARAALAIAMQTFPRVSLDLIYARPGQTVPQWRGELDEAISFGTSHLSLYQLTIEPETPFASLHRSGSLRMPGEDAAAALFEVTHERTSAAGMPAYEISNHARPGAEARHNLLYWRYGSYAGIGPGAHGRLHNDGEVVATANEKQPERWRDMVMRRGLGIAERRTVPHKEAAREHLLMNMRLSEGLDVESYHDRWGTELDLESIRGLEREGLVRFSDGKLAATERGRLVLNSVIAALAC